MKQILLLCLFISFSASIVQVQSQTFMKTYGASGNDFLRSILSTEDGGFIFAGSKTISAEPDQGETDFWIVKLDSKGDVDWDVSYGGLKKDGAYSIVETDDNAFILVGGRNLDCEITKIDSNGEIIWSKKLLDSIQSVGYDLQKTEDGGFLIAGTGKSNVRKVDADGNELWGSKIGEHNYSIVYAGNDKFIVGGDSVFQQFSWNYIPALTLSYVQNENDILWDYPSDRILLGKVKDIIKTNDGGFVIAADSINYVDEYNYEYHAILFKLDTDGNRIWGFPVESLRSIEAVIETDAGEFILSGTVTNMSDNNLALIKVNYEGVEEWQREYGGSGWDYPSSINTTPDGGYIIGGQTESSGNGLYDAWVIKTDENGNVESTGIEDDEATTVPVELQSYPNPFNSTTSIVFNLSESSIVDITIFNMLGELVYSNKALQLNSGTHRVMWQGQRNDGALLPSGIYISTLRVKTNSDKLYKLSNKLVLMK